jgi:hypothetical protein
VNEAANQNEETNAKLELIEDERRRFQETLQLKSDENEGLRSERSELIGRIETLEKEKASLYGETQDIELSKTKEICDLKLIVARLEKSVEENVSNISKSNDENDKISKNLEEMSVEKSRIEELYKQSLAGLEKLNEIERENTDIKVLHEKKTFENEELIEQRRREYEVLEKDHKNLIELSSSKIEELEKKIETDLENLQVNFKFPFKLPHSSASIESIFIHFIFHTRKV